jgi:hypothetical protein
VDPRPAGQRRDQLDLFGNYRTNLALYPAFQESFRKHQFPTLIVWGKNDPIFTVKGAGAFRTDLPKAEIHYLDAGHFALETNAAEIAGYISEFMPRALKARHSRRCAESCWPPSELLGLKRVDAWGSNRTSTLTTTTRVGPGCGGCLTSDHMRSGRSTTLRLIHTRAA